jgi:serine/threonine-protein kinase
MIEKINNFLNKNNNEIKNALWIFKIWKQIWQWWTSIVKECTIDWIDKEYVIKFLLENIATKKSTKYQRFKQAYINLISLKNNSFIIPQIHFDNLIINNELIIPYIIMHKAEKWKLEIAVDFEDFEKKFNWLLDAIDFIHKNWIIHRDLKPENIFFYNDKIVLADFDISKFDDNYFLKLHNTKKNERLANYYYSAPEQKISWWVVDEKSDFYSFGQILYYLINWKPLIWQENIDFSSKWDKYKIYEWLIKKLISEKSENRFFNKDDIKNFLDKIKDKNLSGKYIWNKEKWLYLFLNFINKYTSDIWSWFIKTNNKKDIKNILFELNNIISNTKDFLRYKHYNYSFDYNLVTLRDLPIELSTLNRNSFLDILLWNNFYNIGWLFLNIKSIYIYKQNWLAWDNFIIIETQKPYTNKTLKHKKEEFCIYDKKYKIKREEYDNWYANIKWKKIELMNSKVEIFSKELEDDIYFIWPWNLFEMKNNKPIFEKFYKNYILNWRKINKDSFNGFDNLRRYKPWEENYNRKNTYWY